MRSFVGGCLLGVSEIGRVGRGKEVYDGGGRAEVLVRLLLCGGSTLRYRVAADKVCGGGRQCTACCIYCNQGASHGTGMSLARDSVLREVKLF